MRSAGVPAAAGPTPCRLALDPLRRVAGVLRQAAVEWWRDDTLELSAALAFYTVLSLAPLVVIALAVAGAVFGEEAATRELIAQLEDLIGRAGGEAVRAVAEHARVSRGGPAATALGLAAVALGATAVFTQLQTALNRIWDVKASPERGVVARLLRKRLVGLGLALGAGFLLVVSLLSSALLASSGNVLAVRLPELGWFWRGLETVVSYVVISLLYVTIYKVLPDVRIAWRDVIVGGLVSSALFSIGRSGIGLYLGRMAVGDPYGAAGSLVVLLLWVYYTALVSFYGAELTQVYARRYGSRIRPAEYAVRRGRGKPAAEALPDGAERARPSTV
jgi:membrane protein